MGLPPLSPAAGRAPGSKMTDPKALSTSFTGSEGTAGGSWPVPWVLAHVPPLLLLLSCMLINGWSESGLRAHDMACR